MFRTQVTRELIVDATRRAEAEIARLRRNGRITDLCADDVVQSILTSTWQGRLTWNSDAVPLRVHVYDEIKHTCRRALGRFQGDSPKNIAIESLPEEHALRAEIEEALSSRVLASDYATEDLANRLAQELRRLATNDRDTLLVLDALERGLSGNLEVGNYAGLDTRAVDSAINRLRRLGRRISKEFLATPRPDTPMSHQAPCFRADELAGGTIELASSAINSDATRCRRRAINNFESTNNVHRRAR